MGANSDEVYRNNDFIAWKNVWKKRSELNNSTKEKQSKLMAENNPTVIPRNHKVEEVLAEALPDWKLKDFDYPDCRVFRYNIPRNKID